jgi:multidrug efflux system membrane fusion protein
MIATMILGGEPLRPPVAMVPLDAVLRDPQRSEGFAVMVVERRADSTVAIVRPVELGSPFGNMMEVTQGLAVGETVITTGVNLLKNGDPVRLLP